MVEAGFLRQKGGFAEETWGFLLPPRRFFVPLWHENAKELKNDKLLGNKIEGGSLLDGELRSDDGNECGGRHV